MSASFPHIRELTASDEAALARFFTRNNVPQVLRHFAPFPLDAASARRIAAEPRRDRYFAAFLDGAIAGFAMLRGWDEGFEIPSFGVLIDIESQGRGLGRQLTDHALRIAREMGSRRVRLTVHPDNPRAVQLYQETGFQTAEMLADGRLVMFAELHG